MAPPRPLVRPPQRASRLATVATTALLAAALSSLSSRSLGWLAGGLLSQCPTHGSSLGLTARPSRRTSRTKVLAAVTDTFDPWTVLGISPDSSKEEARKSYKKLITKYHPDVDPSAEAEAKFQQVVRAYAVVTGEDKELDTATLLSNAVANLRNDIDFKRQNIERLKAQVAAEEAEMARKKEQMETIQIQRDQVTQELGAFGGAALGLLVGGPAGAVVGAVIGLALKDRNDAVGQVIRGSGSFVKGVAGAVGKVVEKTSTSKEA